MRYNLFVLLTFSLMTSIVWSQEDYRCWAPADGVPIRQGHHIEWRNPSSAVRTEGELAGEVAYVWSDCRSGDRDVYLQVITPEGEFKFEENGIVVANGRDRQEDPVALACGDGGWIIAWEDYHIFDDPLDGIPNNEIYCTKVNDNGERLWGLDAYGLRVSLYRSNKQNLSIIEDRDGGCIIAWDEYRRGWEYGIYGMHITVNGERDVRWGENGSLLTTPVRDQNDKQVMSDNAGGMIICWQHPGQRDGGNTRAQRVSEAGELLWGRLGGISVCPLQTFQFRARLCSDGQSGAFISWVDRRNREESGLDIYIQHVDQNGNLLWGDVAGGLPFCTTEFDQNDVQIVASGNGEAILIWEDERDFEGEYNLYGMKISGNEEMIRLWEPEQGVPIAVADRNIDNPKLCMNGEEDAFIIFESERARGENEIDIHMQHFNSDGERLLGESGIAICAVDDKDVHNRLVTVINPTANGGCNIGWSDFRTGSCAIFTQSISADGETRYQENGTAVAQGISHNALFPKLLSRDDGRSILIWQDGRYGDQGCVPFVQFLSDEGEDVAVEFETGGIPATVSEEGGATDIDAILCDNGNTILVWQDHHQIEGHDNPPYTILLQKISREGELLWGDSGLICAESDFDQKSPQLCTDAENGVIVLWRAAENAEIDNIYAQRIDHDGELQWGDRGIQITDNNAGEIVEKIIPDGNGGVVFVWKSFNMESDDDLYVQRISLDGEKLWGEEGQVLCDQFNKQRHPVLVTHQAGYVVVWTDGRDDELGAPQDNIYGQFIDTNGNLLWEETGFLICGAEGHQQYPDVTISNDGNIWIVWEDDRRRHKDIYVQKIRNSIDEQGRPAVLFIDNGTNICGVDGDSKSPKITHDGNNGVWVVWKDYGQEIYWSDVFATHLRSNGRRFDGWERYGNMVCGGLYSQRNPELSLLTSNGEDGCVIVWEDNRSTGREEITNIYMQRLDDDMVSVYEKPRELIPSEYSIDSVYPSPFNSQTVVIFTTPQDGQVSLGLFDISGRFIRQVSSDWFPAGKHRISVDGENLSAGTYIVKLEAGGFVSDVKVTLVR
ncbi:MAG: T9SS type A sorting domain-containing protein [Calditrichaeota bacterium]|nr:T9SS type A sorting domain-containing protein [Calditrichota bacterium]